MDLEALVTDELREAPAAYALEWFEVEASVAPRRRTRGRACARPAASSSEGSFTGDGPVDAFFRAINAAIGTTPGCASSTSTR